MKLGSILLGAAALAGGVWAYKHYQDQAQQGEPLQPQTPDDYIVDEWVTALPDMKSARSQIWQNVQEGHFYGTWATFGPDGETVISSGSTPNRPGIQATRQDLLKLFLTQASVQRAATRTSNPYG